MAPPKDVKVKAPPPSSKIAKSNSNSKMNKSQSKKKVKTRVSASKHTPTDPSKQNDEIPIYKGYNIDEVLDIVMETVSNHSKHVKQAVVTPIADFRKDLGLDEDDLVDLSFEFEDRFETWIPCEVVSKLKCCEDVAKYIMSETNQLHASQREM